MAKNTIYGMNEIAMDIIEKNGAKHNDSRLEKASKWFKTPGYHQTHPVNRKDDKNE